MKERALHHYLDALCREGGSDLHLVPGSAPRMRLDGRLEAWGDEVLTSRWVESQLSAVLGPEGRLLLEEQGSADAGYDAGPIGRFRVNAFYHQRGTAAVFRRIPARVPTPDELRLPEAARALARAASGLLLVTGTAGSGKSTTLAALVEQINRERAGHILTIEDPIEFLHEEGGCLISQREVGTHVDSYTTALRAALREDPDVIVVGELRDAETMQLALSAAETGHLVIATLHTVSAVRAVDRIVDAFDSRRQEQVRAQLAETLRGVVAQRLLPMRTGRGRVAAFEILVNTPPVAQGLRTRKSAVVESAMTSRAAGMQTLESALALLVTQGLVSAEDAARVGEREKLAAALEVV